MAATAATARFARVAILALFAAFGGCSAEPEAPTAEADYATYCALCHGDKGEGYLAPRANALANAHFLAAADDAFLLAGVIEGRPGTKMSAWGDAHGGPLTAAQAKGLVDLMRSWQGNVTLKLDSSPLAGDLATGQKLWTDSCATCHGADGSGGSAMSVNHPVFLRTASDSLLRASIAEGRPGTAMPAYGTKLSPAQVDSLVRAIRAMEKQP